MSSKIHYCKVLLCALLCCSLGAVTYLNTLKCGIVYDDEPAIKKNQDLRPDTPWSNILTHDFWGGSLTSPSSHKSYRPLCVLTYRLNYLFHGLEPMGYHLVNVVLHAVACFLFVCVCILVGGAVWPGLVAGMLFAVHPVHTEAVSELDVVRGCGLLLGLETTVQYSVEWGPLSIMARGGAISGAHNPLKDN